MFQILSGIAYGDKVYVPGQEEEFTAALAGGRQDDTVKVLSYLASRGVVVLPPPVKTVPEEPPRVAKVKTVPVERTTKPKAKPKPKPRPRRPRSTPKPK